MFENSRRGRQARNFAKNVPKILDLKSSSEQTFSENCRWVPLKFAFFFYILEIKSRHKRLQCLCTTCENKTCTTDGSCLIYRNPEDGKHVKRCIVDGEDRDLICSNVLPHKEDVRCCETDFCNRRLVPGKISAC